MKAPAWQVGLPSPDPLPGHQNPLTLHKWCLYGVKVLYLGVRKGTWRQRCGVSREHWENEERVRKAMRAEEWLGQPLKNKVKTALVELPVVPGYSPVPSQRCLQSKEWLLASEVYSWLCQRHTEIRNAENGIIR